MPLPSDFRWNTHLGRPTLYLNRQALGDYQPHNDQWIVHVGYHRMAYQLRQSKLVSEAAAIAYLERWVQKWEQAIREEVGPRIPYPPAPPEVLPAVVDPVIVVAPRKPRRGRRSPLG